MMDEGYNLSGFHFLDRCVEVPLDWSRPDDSERIEVFFREVCRSTRRNEDLPLLVFLQGGPGGKSPRPTSGGPGWLLEAVKHYRVILPDQRGTGRSSRVTGPTMAGFADADAGAEFLARFDAHAVVADLEHIRKTVYNGARWETLGQSYGGFLTLNYLSYAPEGLAKCYITGGIPSLDPNADEVYRRTYPRVKRKMVDYLARLPADGQKLDEIADFTHTHQPILPNGDPLTVRRLQSLGLLLGMGDGVERLHWLIEEAFTDERRQALNLHFLNEVMTLTGLDDNPLFAAIHENVYANPDGATRWAAERERARYPEFAASHRPLYLTGEMIYPWMFDEIATLKPFRDAARRLAEKPLDRPYYDRQVLARNTVPIAAAIYFDDMFVDAGLSVETAESIPGLRYWVTNEYEHDGSRQDPRVFAHLRKLIEDQ